VISTSHEHLSRIARIARGRRGQCDTDGESEQTQNGAHYIGRLRAIAGKPVGFKSVIGAYGWLEAMCHDIQKRGIESAPDFITVDSGDGGTGAAPMR